MRPWDISTRGADRQRENWNTAYGIRHCGAGNGKYKTLKFRENTTKKRKNKTAVQERKKTHSWTNL